MDGRSNFWHRPNGSVRTGAVFPWVQGDVLLSFGSSAALSRAPWSEGEVDGVGAADEEGDALALVLALGLGLGEADGVGSVLELGVGSGSLVRLAAGSSSLLREQPARTTLSSRVTAATVRSAGRFLVGGMAPA